LLLLHAEMLGVRRGLAAGAGFGVQSAVAVSQAYRVGVATSILTGPNPSGQSVAELSVVITGGTQGIGYGYAREFLRRGHRVTICGRDPRRVSAAVDKLRAECQAGERVDGTVCDTADLAATQALWDHALARFGHVDIFVNNAGFARTGVSFAANTPAEIETMIRSNVIGSMHAAQVAIAGMKKQGSGSLYLTLGGGGASGRVVPGMAVYSTSKRAVKYFADSLVKERREIKDDSILIGTISPGVNITEGMLREFSELTPVERNKALKQLNFIGDHVEDTTAFIVDAILANKKQGHAITWLTGGRLLKRSLGMMFGKRDVLSRYGLKVQV
jgi:NAD(P)-dependent dehydrogenase (short-subunit alcohol dehydrogenase family)